MFGIVNTLALEVEIDGCGVERFFRINGLHARRDADRNLVGVEIQRDAVVAGSYFPRLRGACVDVGFIFFNVDLSADRQRGVFGGGAVAVAAIDCIPVIAESSCKGEVCEAIARIREVHIVPNIDISAFGRLLDALGRAPVDAVDVADDVKVSRARSDYGIVVAAAAEVDVGFGPYAIVFAGCFDVAIGITGGRPWPSRSLPRVCLSSRLLLPYSNPLKSAGR